MEKIITQEEYLMLRAKTLEDYNQMLVAQGAHGRNDFSQELKLTCDDCPMRFTCEFAADLYNTNGDCLA